MSYLIHPIEWKILERAMLLGIERGVTRSCGKLFVRPWNRSGNTHLSGDFEVARLCVLEQLAPEYAIAESELRTVSPRAAKAAATRATNLAKKSVAELGEYGAQHKLTETKLRRAHINARYGIAPDPTIITELATNSQRRWFDAIHAFAEKNQAHRQRYAQKIAAQFEGMSSHVSFQRDEEDTVAKDFGSESAPVVSPSSPLNKENLEADSEAHLAANWSASIGSERTTERLTIFTTSLSSGARNLKNVPGFALFITFKQEVWIDRIRVLPGTFRVVSYELPKPWIDGNLEPTTAPSTLC